LNATERRAGTGSINRGEPLVTIGVPVYNGERFLAQCLDSLLSQTLRDFILLISDNASTDGTAEICKRYVESDSRLRYHRNHTNVGMYGNINFVLRSVRTRYVKLANADDFWTPTMLNDAVEAMESDPSLVLCYPRAVLVDQVGREIRRYENPLHLMDDDPVVRFRRVLTELGLVNQLLGVIRTDAVRLALPLMSQPRADCVFLAELSLYGKIMEIPEYQYFRRFHEEASSWDRGSEAHQIRRVFREGTRRIRLGTWKYYCGLVRRSLHSPLDYGPKLKLLLFLGRQFAWDRSALLGELRQLLRPSRMAGSSEARKVRR
jgi:glycosyltransferase involved in cell wall biosynthesis